LPAENLEVFIKALDTQPITVAFHVHDDLYFYKSGALNTTNMCFDIGSSINHGVLAVGYKLDWEKGRAYIKLKNSWGSDWGENGFFRFAIENPREGEDYSGPCNLLKYGSFL